MKVRKREETKKVDLFATDSELERGFDRFGFENRVLIPALEAINHTELYSVVAQGDGSLFLKGKTPNGYNIKGYSITAKVADMDQIEKARVDESKNRKLQ